MSQVPEDLSAATISASLTSAGVTDLPPGSAEKFLAYLRLLVRWNSRLNLTAIRGAREMVERHLVECAFAAQHLPGDVTSLLDYGSGAGLPGIPIAVCLPTVKVLLAESQAKKASFLREVVRVTDLPAEVFHGRVEDLPPERLFDAVALRAVEKMEEAVVQAGARSRKYLVLFSTVGKGPPLTGLLPEFDWFTPIFLPNTEQMELLVGQKR